MSLSAKSKKLLVLFLLWTVYILVGVFVFRAVEDDGGAENRRNEKLLETLKRNITKAFNMTDAQFDNIAQQIMSASSSTPEWNYASSVSFVVQLLTTIGYGNITPATTGGRILCIFYAFFGIPLNILFLQLIGEKMLHGEQFLLTAIEKRCLKKQGPPKYLNEKCFMFGLLVLIALLLASAAAHMEIDNWTFLEGFYCYFITFTTVGFGDFIPGGDGSNVGHLSIRIMFIILGLVAMSNVLNAFIGCSEAAQLYTRLKTCCGRERMFRVHKEENFGSELDDGIEQ